MADLRTMPMRFAAVRAALARGVDLAEVVAESCRRVAGAPAGIFTAVVPPEQAVERAHLAMRRARDGAHAPLLGLTFCVKDNIHVAGMATTASCPGLSIRPKESAAAVLALERAGAVLVGKTAMDQFATGLSGTRCPEPLPRNALHPDHIPGGSSSGSAVAVAGDLAAFALGTDTGGSGRVPAACNGIVGVKPTIGLVSTRGLLPTSHLLDCVSIFARRCADASEVLRTVARPDPREPTPERVRDGVVERPSGSMQLAVPRRDLLEFGDDASEKAHARNLDGLEALGFSLAEIDFSPFAEAGRLVFQSALVAERLANSLDLVADRPATVHPVVRAAIKAGLGYSARDAFDAIERLRQFRRWASAALSPFAAFVVPTVPTIFTVADMLASPLDRNTVLGRYTYFVNVMDLCAVAVPGRRRADGLPSSLSFVGLPGADAAMASLASRFEAWVDEAPPA